MADNAEIDLRMDLSDPGQKQKIVGKGKAGTWNVVYHKDPWLNCQGRLLDGTRFSLQAVDLLQKRSRWKTNPRGKKKYKTKKKFGGELHLTLSYKPGKYGKTAVLANDATGAIQLPPTLLLKRCEVSESRIHLRAATKERWSPVEASPEEDNSISISHQAAMMFLSAYQVLNLGKRLSKAGGQ